MNCQLIHLLDKDINTKERCPYCGRESVGYDKVKRYFIDEKLIRRELWIERYSCKVCKKVFRKLPDIILPYKQYSSTVIKKVVDGEITCETLGYEDYPCESTMLRWLKEFTH